MPTAFPTALDDFVNPLPTNPLSNPSHSDQHANLNDAVEAIEARVGIAGSADPASIENRLAVIGGSTRADEVPSGTVNGVNAVFVLAHTPLTNSLVVYLNGLRLRSGSGNDYVLATATLTFEAGMVPQAGDSLSANYSY